MPFQPIDPQRFAAIILAAGASRRMGTNKMLLELDGETLVRRAARRARSAGLSPIIVVVGYEPERVEAALDGFTCEFAINPDFTGPTSASLHKGLEQVPADAAGAVVILGDMVHVTAEMLRAVVDAARTSTAPLVVSHYGDVTAPPILYRRSLFDELRAWHGEGCGKAVVQAHITEAHVCDWPVSALTDADTPEDFAAIARPND